MSYCVTVMIPIPQACVVLKYSYLCENTVHHSIPAVHIAQFGILKCIETLPKTKMNRDLKNPIEFLNTHFCFSLFSKPKNFLILKRTIYFCLLVNSNSIGVISFRSCNFVCTQ